MIDKKALKKSTKDVDAAAKFPIVGMGASAGGLDAFEHFFHHLPAQNGMAFVLVQHLDPSHSSALTEILQRSTEMPVVEVEDQMAVAPNHVYVIPPNREMEILHGKLQLSIPSGARGSSMPIDVFLRSLAQDQAENAIGVLLSGTGTDGTLGLRAIMGLGGLTLVQDPKTAKFDGMPVSAINSGYAHYVLPVEQMPETMLADFHRFIPTIQAHDAIDSSLTINNINHILTILRSVSGHDFSQYKKTTITRRIERRMATHSIDQAEIYVRYLKDNPSEVQMLFKELLINVTSFFRDPEAFLEVKRLVLPQLLKDKPDGYIFRAWIPGCSTGEEAYSLAILLREWMIDHQHDYQVQIYATDIDDDAIETARAGLYLSNIEQDVSSERLRRFFVKEDSGYRVKKEIRDMIVFALQNVIKDPPFTKLDLLSCRNVMIYLEADLQNKLIPVFHYSLKPDGVLLLSPSESIGQHSDLFTPLSRKWKFYHAVHTGISASRILTTGVPWTSAHLPKLPDIVAQKKREINFVELSRRMLLQCFAPASVVTDLHGNILYVHGDTGKYLRPAPGKASLNVVEMAREGLQIELLAAIYAKPKDHDAYLNNLLSIKTNGGFTDVNLSVRKIFSADAPEGLFLISFQDVEADPHVKPKRLAKVVSNSAKLRIELLEQELAHTKETLLATIEEQQVSNEELMSGNEEMQSTNEELQSTNEELETSKEELQSVNEELITVNNELQSNIEQLSNMQSDMKNLLDNVTVGIIFLDQHLHIRRFTREATQLYRLVALDIGRHLGDIKSNLEDDDLLIPAQQVLDTLIPFEREIKSTSGLWYLIRIQPYRSLDNVIDGVVFTFTNITANLEFQNMQEALMLSESIVNTVREPLVVLDHELKVTFVSHAFYSVFKVHSDEVIHRSIFELGNHQWDIPALRSLLENVVSRGEVFDNYRIEHDFPNIGFRKMLLNARRIMSKTGGVQLILLAIQEA